MSKFLNPGSLPGSSGVRPPRAANTPAGQPSRSAGASLPERV